jgi:hypothetical protein
MVERECRSFCFSSTYLSCVTGLTQPTMREMTRESHQRQAGFLGRLGEGFPRESMGEFRESWGRLRESLLWQLLNGHAKSFRKF